MAKNKYFGSSLGLTVLKDNPVSPANGMVARITNTSNSGYLIGNNLGCWLADTVAETIAASGELAQAANYAPAATYDNTLSSVTDSGFTSTGGTTADRVALNLATVAGRTYSVSMRLDSVSAGTVIPFIKDASGGGGNTIQTLAGLTVGALVTVNFVATTTTTSILWANATAGSTYAISGVSAKLVSPDRSVKNKGLTLIGSLVKSAVASGAQLVGFSGFSASNYLEQPYNSDLDFGTGDFCIMLWATPRATNYGPFIALNDPLVAQGSAGTFYVKGGPNSAYLYGHGLSTGEFSMPSGQYSHIVAVRRSGVAELWLNGVKVWSGTYTDDLNTRGSGRVLTVGRSVLNPGTYESHPGAVSMVRIGATAPSADQIAQIYSDELALFQPNAKCTIDGTSSAITALAYDDSANILQVGTSWGRSAFSGLVRTESSATQVGAVTTLAAGGGAHVTAGTSGARTVQPDLSYYVPNKFDRWALFDLSTGKIVSKDTDSGTTATIDSVGNGYYRVRLSAVAQATGSGGVYTYVAPTAGVLPQSLVYNGDGISGLYAWQEDFIDGLVMQSPIATTNTTVTRAADVIGTGTGLVYSNVAITEPNYSAATTYNLNDIVHDPATHLTYKSLIASNLNKPLTDTASWLQLNVTNRWLMFDQYSGTQTSNAEEIIVTVAPATIAQGVFLANLDATEVRISVTDLTEGVVHQETISLVESVSSSSFYNWCFKRLRNKQSTVSVTLPPYANALITIAIKKPGGTAKCGVCAIGPVVDVGISQQGLGREIKDYSTINFNFDGTSNQVVRGFSKRMDLDVVIDYDQVDTVISALEGYRQKPVAWIASPDYDSACVFGRYSSFKNVMNDWPLAKMSLQIEGTV